MTSLYDLFDPTRNPPALAWENDLLSKLTGSMDQAQHELGDAAQSADILNTASLRHARRMVDTHTARARNGMEKTGALMAQWREAQAQGTLLGHYQDYARDLAERLTLCADTMRKRGDIFLDHEAKGCPPVLVYAYEKVMDGADQPYPCNFELLRILPPEGIEVHDWKRPYVIIDPRAGHGPGIGGFKRDSQVGVALRDGHPVYFVSFRRKPEPGQYLAYVTRAEAAFVREVMRLHPQAAKPIVVGNCQGGWSTLLLAATNPDLTGPVVINGAPVATWAGTVGENPMRYNGGVFGGTWIPMLLSDLGGGLFDGAHLVQNFEMMNPSRTMLRKYTDLLRDIDEGDGVFLEFETWWGGFFLLNEPEIRWIVEQLFVGNRLIKNEARIEPGRPVDLKSIRAPIIVFASRGDNITPPQQALNWIAETYADVTEIKIRGQRILYMVHEQVGHLGIFVSSKIANKEHTEVASTLKTIEALAPGLYEMKIDDIVGEGHDRQFMVSFAERTLADIRALDDGLFDEKPFAAVARLSEAQAQGYDMVLRPLVKAMVTPSMAEASRALHPQRVMRALASSRNPMMQMLPAAAARLRENRRKASDDNAFLQWEALMASTSEHLMDFWRDSRDMAVELSFYSLWGTPWMRMLGRTHEARRTLKSAAELRNLPEVTHALFNIERGGFVEAVIRMLVLLADSRGTVRRDRLERASRVLTQDEPFASLTASERALIIHEQTLIATYEPLRAVVTLSSLLKTPEEREAALQVVRFVPGLISEMSPHTLDMLQRFSQVLDLPPITGDVPKDPLTKSAARNRVSAAQ